MGREKSKGKIAGRFLALPHSLLDCEAFIELSAPATRLLIDLARQYMGTNNGRLLCTLSALKTRGWTSNDTLQRARRELEEAKLIQMTRYAAKPRRAAWWALCWLPLDYDTLMDIGRDEFALKQFFRPADLSLKRIRAMA